MWERVTQHLQKGPGCKRVRRSKFLYPADSVFMFSIWSEQLTSTSSASWAPPFKLTLNDTVVIPELHYHPTSSWEIPPLNKVAALECGGWVPVEPWASLMVLRFRVIWLMFAEHLLYTRPSMKHFSLWWILCPPPHRWENRGLESEIGWPRPHSWWQQRFWPSQPDSRACVPDWDAAVAVEHPAPGQPCPVVSPGIERWRVVQIH